MASGREELVIEMYVTAKIAETEEVGKRGGDDHSLEWRQSLA